jgi:MFS family permease
MKSVSMDEQFDIAGSDELNSTFFSRFLNSPQAWIILACGWSFYLYEYLLRVSPKVMMDPLMNHFNLTAVGFGFLASLYYWAYVPLQIPCGVIVDYWGPRKVVTMSALLCAIGSFMFAGSETLFVAQFGRFLIGAGSACAYISCMKIASQWFKPTKFALIAGVSQMMGTMGGVSGDVPLANLVNACGWQTSMNFGAIGALVLAVISWIIIRDRPADVPHVKKSINTHIMEDLKSIMTNKQILLVGIYGCATFLTLTAFADLWGVPYMMERFGISNTLASRGTTAIYIGFAIGSTFSSSVSDYFKSRVKVMSISAIGTAIGFGLIFFLPDVPLEVIYGLMFCTGVLSGGQILYFTVAVENSNKESTASTVGFTNAFVMVSGLIFQPLLGYILDIFWDGQMKTADVRMYSVDAYKYALSILLLTSVIAYFLMKFVKETYPVEE